MAKDYKNDTKTKEKLEKISHTKRETYENLHRCESGLDGGVCLGGHYYPYARNQSCSYRWQAVHRVRTEDREVYAEEVKTRRTPFRTGSWPWPNEAHHLIPKAELLNVVCEIAASAPGNVELQIIEDLLRNKYNINHHCNMMILPQEAIQSSRLGLPTHPSFDYLPEDAEDRHDTRFHKNYSAEVNMKLRQILSPYTDWLEKKCENPPEGREIVEKLKAFSQKLHDIIVSNRKSFLLMHRDGSETTMSINSKFFQDLVASIPL